MSSYPATVVDAGTTIVTYIEHATPYSGSVYTLISSGVYLSSTTFVVYQPQPTDMAVGKTMDDLELQCNACAPATFKSDAQCDALGLDTGCQGQCPQKNGLWWCRQLAPSDVLLTLELEMGRACWGNGTFFRQLRTPCVYSDHRVACVPCQGRINSWAPLNWV